MIFTIHSRIKNRAIVEQYVINLMNELGINRLQRNIDIRFRKKLDQDAMGYCWGDRDEVEIEINRTVSWEEQMIALAHEMVHAKQFFREELDPYFYWKKRNWSNCAYEHQPWEKSAYYWEEKLFKKCYPSAHSSIGLEQQPSKL